MDNEERSTTEEWPLPFGNENTGEENMIPVTETGESPVEEPHTAATSLIPDADSITDVLRRRGFFESLSQVECPEQRLKQLLGEFEMQAQKRLLEADQLAEKKTENLQEYIRQCTEKISELRMKLQEAEQYREADDPDLVLLLLEKEKQENLLQELLDKFARVKIRLGEAKAGIIGKSLEEAAQQVERALQIQRTVYDETRLLNQKKFSDEKDYLARLAKCFQELYTSYEERYRKVNKYLGVLDVDGISPVTTQVLTTIGTISFGAAGFFFSTFAGNTGFGNRDVLYFVLGGLIDTAKLSSNGFVTVGLLAALILLVTVVSWGCNYLINRLKKREEEILSEFGLTARVAKKLKEFEYKGFAKSNNWYAFWLQLIPGILIAGLIIISISLTSYSTQLGALNASSEGLVVGTSIAISLAGLIYLYIIKIVEPRLLKKYNADAGYRVNWISGNWELVVILAAFLVFSICIIALPYDGESSSGILSISQRTRYAILLFIAICLVGAMSFAYSVRSRGLIETSRFLEKVMRWLNSTIAYCTSPEAPELYHDINEEHGNIVHHVLKQLSFRAGIDQPPPGPDRKKEKKKWSFGRFMQSILRRKKDEENVQPEPVAVLMIIEPWEERYFPHIIDEMRSIEFEYRERKVSLVKAEEQVEDYRSAKAMLLRKYEASIREYELAIKGYKKSMEMVIEERADRNRMISLEYSKDVTDLQDGFHLGIWYRENDMGPLPGYFDTCKPGMPVIPVNPVVSPLTPSI